jgi:hypothetical protein
MPDKRMRRRGEQGLGLIESVVMGSVIILIAMVLIDLIVMVLANGVNDAAAKNAARAAAGQSTLPKAVEAARNAVQENKPSGFISSLILQSVDYDPKKNVSCITKMEIRLPIPVPVVGGSYVFMAQATEPIVAR